MQYLLTSPSIALEKVPFARDGARVRIVGSRSKILSVGKTIRTRENSGRVGGRHPNDQSELVRGWKEGHLLPEETGKGQDVVLSKA